MVVLQRALLRTLQQPSHRSFRFLQQKFLHNCNRITTLQPHKCQLRLLHPCCFQQNYQCSHCSTATSQNDMPDKVPTHGLHDKWYPKWEANKYYFRGKQSNSEAASEGHTAFVMMLPPPNVTGTLHMGHALSIALQDTLVRWHGMSGRCVVWVPGCDHAGIATQTVVEQHLQKTAGTTRQQLGRDRFVEEVWAWKDAKESRIYHQLRRLGAALDWDKAVFTMDPGMCEAVVEAFIALYDSGAVYRAARPVHYCTALQSVISDIEVESVPVSGPTAISVPGYSAPVTFGLLYNIAYPLVDGEERLVVSTTRPETMPGDVAIMVNPGDARYSHLVGRRVHHPLREGVTLPIIADDAVDMKLGTGCVKVTPGSSAVDHAVGAAHGLPSLDIFTDDGHCTDVVPDLQGVGRFTSRDMILTRLRTAGLLLEERPHTMTLPCCSRTGDVLETRPLPQWFVATASMEQRALAAVESGQLRLSPASARASWANWLQSSRDSGAARDWCVSRQLWWGHRVPMYRVWTDSDSEQWVAARSLHHAREKAATTFGWPEAAVHTEQDSDVLDTWFSSALFPFAALGWPKKTDLYAQYYPTTQLVTGYDILFFWVVRMVMLGTQLTGKLPFESVTVHGLVTDEHGAKMSKSKGNVVDPLELIDGRLAHPQDDAPVPPPVGADALRMYLLSQDLSSDQVTFSRAQCESYRTLTNKMWQTVRFMRQANAVHNAPLLSSGQLRLVVGELSVMERWLLHCCHQLVSAAHESLSSSRPHGLVNAFTHFWRTQLCDTYLEAIKPIVYGGESQRERAMSSLSVCVECARTALLCIAPVMPYLCEELYTWLPTLQAQQQRPSVMAEEYPSPDQYSEWRCPAVEAEVTAWLEVVAALRSLRTSYNITSKNLSGSVYSSDPVMTRASAEMSALTCHLARLAQLQVSQVDEGERRPPVPCLTRPVTERTSVHLHVQDDFDAGKEIARLQKKLAKMTKQLMQLTKRRATPDKMEDHKDNMVKIEEMIASLQNLQQKSKPLS